MRGKYYTNSIGETLQKLEVLKRSHFQTITDAWSEIMPQSMHSMKPYKLFNGTLTVTVNIPAIYVQHFAEDIKTICNDYLRDMVVANVRFKSR